MGPAAKVSNRLTLIAGLMTTSAGTAAATATTSGSYRPTDLDVDPHPDVCPAPAPDAAAAGRFLSAFDGTDPNGVWQLYAVDDVIGHPGVLSRGCSLRLTTTAPAEPRSTGARRQGRRCRRECVGCLLRALRRHTTYRVVLTTRVRDLAGNRLDQDAGTPGRQRASWAFTTR